MFRMLAGFLRYRGPVPPGSVALRVISSLPTLLSARRKSELVLKEELFWTGPLFTEAVPLLLLVFSGTSFSRGLRTGA